MNTALSFLKNLETDTQHGNIALRIAQMHLDAHEWGEAIQAVERALAKGGLDSPSEAYTLLASCYNKIGCEQLAARALNEWQSKTRIN